jgi:hypothetical protein
MGLKEEEKEPMIYNPSKEWMNMKLDKTQQQ